jgi:hypothetical protein
VFYLARKQGITLTEDFSGAEADTYNMEYFIRKMTRSLEKAKKLLSDYSELQEFLDRPLPD